MAVVIINKNNFKEKVLEESKTVLIDFWASWCVPCKMLSPVVDQIAEENSEIIVGKVNVDDEPELAEHFQIMSIPTLMVFKNGKMVQKSVGVQPKNTIEKMIK